VKPATPSERRRPSAVSPTKQKHAGVLIALILMCSVGGSALLPCMCVGDGPEAKQKKGGHKTNRQRKGRKPCRKKTRKMSGARSKRGTKSQLLPD
jgi:hypothetical protein